MKYELSTTIIPQSDRAEINKTILALINSTDLQGITPQDIYQGYTGIGGLHGLNRKDYQSYSEFSDAKKEIEHGQFFTPGSVIEQISQLLQMRKDEFICDLTCGAGAFFNHFNEGNCYGNEIDINAVDVAKFLYPMSNITCGDIKHYKPPISFDYIVGNPPFNLEFIIDKHRVKSQHFYCIKAAELLKPGGLMICVVPASYLDDEFFNRTAIEDLDERFSFLFQYLLPANAFAPMGVDKFETKVICFQRRSDVILHKPYANTYVSVAEAAKILHETQEQRALLRIKLQAEYLTKTSDGFNYKVRKYLYEIKTQKILVPQYAKAYELVEQLRNQVRPPGMEEKEWDKHKLTEKRVLNRLRKVVRSQNKKSADVTRLVKTQYGFKLKPYSEKAKRRLNGEPTHVSFNEILTGQRSLSYLKIEGAHAKLMRRKMAAFERETQSFREMPRNEKIDTWLKRFTFISPKDKQAYEFNQIQHNDLGLALQKQYACLNWQQGSGKTSAAYAWGKFKPQRNTFIVGPAVAVSLTWANFMKVNRENFIHVKKRRDIERIKPGDFVLVSLDLLINFEREIKAYVKRCGHKVNVVLDESDEITNDASKRTKAMLSCFRKCRRKLETTGTTTRNNITELYSQVEFLYNNSANMLCYADTYYIEEAIRKKDAADDYGTMIREKTNPYFMKPFPPYYGPTVFKRCFNPAKSSVFGIDKHNQDLYNEQYLRDLISQMIITRKFKEIAGDKFKVNTITCEQSMAERHVYGKIIRDLQSVIPQFFNNTGHDRKDTMLNILRQLTLLIKATSMPQLFADYHGSPVPTKAQTIEAWAADRNAKCAIGVTSKEALNWYGSFFSRRFANREIFLIDGEIPFHKRQEIITRFEATDNGILICTQQSLKSSVNIPSCNHVMLESKQWNVPKMEQFYFRFIRYDSAEDTEVTFVSYAGTIEMNLLALLMDKEKLNDFVKTLEYREDSDIYGEFGIDTNILNSILTKERDEEGHMYIDWGNASTV